MSSNEKPLQIGLKFTRTSDDIALYDILKGYGKGNIKSHLHRAINLYESCQRTDNVDAAVFILKTIYPHVVHELRTEHNITMEIRLEALESNMKQQATKDDVQSAVEEIMARMEMLATQQSVDSLTWVAAQLLKKYTNPQQGLPPGTMLLAEEIVKNDKPTQ